MLGHLLVAQTSGHIHLVFYWKKLPRRGFHSQMREFCPAAARNSMQKPYKLLFPYENVSDCPRTLAIINKLHSGTKDSALLPFKKFSSS